MDNGLASAERQLERVMAERDRYREALQGIAHRALEVPIGTPAFPLARALGDIAVAALDASDRP